MGQPGFIQKQITFLGNKVRTSWTSTKSGSPESRQVLRNSMSEHRETMNGLILVALVLLCRLELISAQVFDGQQHLWRVHHGCIVFTDFQGLPRLLLCLHHLSCSTTS